MERWTATQSTVRLLYTGLILAARIGSLKYNTSIESRSSLNSTHHLNPTAHKSVSNARAVLGLFSSAPMRHLHRKMISVWINGSNWAISSQSKKNNAAKFFSTLSARGTKTISCSIVQEQSATKSFANFISLCSPTLSSSTHSGNVLIWWILLQRLTQTSWGKTPSISSKSKVTKTNGHPLSSGS